MLLQQSCNKHAPGEKPRYEFKTMPRREQMTTNMQIDIENKTIKKSRNKKHSTPIWSVVWRFLLFCAIFDGGIYFYFHSIQNTTVAEGIRKIRIAVHGIEDQKIERIHKTNIYTQQKNNTRSEEPENNKESMYVGNKDTKTNPHQYSPLNSSNRAERVDKLYCWEDKNGIKHFSNIGYPIDGYFNVVKFE